MKTKIFYTLPKFCSKGIKTNFNSVTYFFLLIIFTITVYGQDNLLPIESHLNPDGTINTSSGISGTLDMKGWQMVPDSKTKQPKFYRDSDDPETDTWENVGGSSITNDDILSIAIDASGNVYVGGAFTQIVGVSANRIAKWNGSTWSALGSGMNGEVFAVAVSGDTVYAGGNFSTAGGVIARNIAQWNGSMWRPLANGTNNIVRTIAVIGRVVYIGGDFTTVNLLLVVNRIARWNVSSWTIVGSGSEIGMNNTVNTIKISGSDLYVGGNFGLPPIN